MRESIGLEIKIHYPDDRDRVITRVILGWLQVIITSVNELLHYTYIRISDGNTQFRVSQADHTDDDGDRSPHSV